MDQPFDSDVMDDLAAESPYSPSLEQDVWTDEFDAGAFEDDEEFEDESDLNDLDALETTGEPRYLHHDRFEDDFEDELSNEFEEATTRASRSWDAVVASALSAPTTSRFLQQLLQEMRRTAPHKDGRKTRSHQNGHKFPRQAHVKRNNTRLLTSEHNGSSNANRGPQTPSIEPFLSKLVTEQPTSDHHALAQLIPWVESTDAVEIASPVIAGLALRSALPHLSQLSQPIRQQLVETVRQAIATLAHQHGTHAIRAIAPMLQSVQKVARQRHLPNRELPLAVQRTTRKVAANTDLVTHLAQSHQGLHSKAPRSATVQRIGSKGDMQRLVITGPVEIIIRSI